MIMLERLQKAIARSGMYSRREAERLITHGKVSVNGKIVSELGTQIDPGKDIIKIDGRKVIIRKDKIVIAFYKPRKCLCTSSDPEGRPVIMDFLPKDCRGLKIAGRLDFNMTGLVILTNDGELANRLTHPRFGSTRIYTIKLKKPSEDKQLDKIGKDILSVRNLADSWIEVKIRCGVEKKLFYLFLKAGIMPEKVKRIAIGSIKLGKLQPGEFRRLIPEEIKELSV